MQKQKDSYESLMEAHGQRLNAWVTEAQALKAGRKGAEWKVERKREGRAGACSVTKKLGN
jgi:hypothetical protein